MILGQLRMGARQAKNAPLDKDKDKDEDGGADPPRWADVYLPVSSESPARGAL